MTIQAADSELQFRRWKLFIDHGFISCGDRVGVPGVYRDGNVSMIAEIKNQCVLLLKLLIKKTNVILVNDFKSLSMQQLTF